VTGETLVWDVARVGGLLAYVLLTASVAMGIALSLGWRSPRWTRFVTNELHRFVTLVAIVFTGIHTVAVAVDPFIGFTPAEVLVPMLSHYRPIWVALGIVAAYLLLAIYASEWVRPRIGYRWWRRFHYLSFAGFVLALVHGVATGSDTRAPWAIVLYAGSIVLVGALLVARLLPVGQGRRHPVVAALSASVLVFGVIWATSGPLQAGWNAVANDGRGTGATPQTLAALGITTATGATSGSASGSASPPPAPAPTPSTVQAPFQARVAGGDDGSLTLVGQLQGAAGNQFEMQLNNVSSGPFGQVQLQGADGRTCTGPVTQVGNSTVTATCSTGDGASWNIQLDVQSVDRRSVSGTLTATPATQSGVGGAGTGS
jgi:Ferric reductase like transmembrane component